MVCGVILPLARSPAIYPVIIGVLWHLTGLPLPEPVRLFVDLLARATAPLTLFCLGMSLPTISRGVLGEAAIASFLKLIVMP
jgi:malonate transporter